MIFRYSNSKSRHTAKLKIAASPANNFEGTYAGFFAGTAPLLITSI